jgi:hypothetical protein
MQSVAGIRQHVAGLRKVVEVIHSRKQDYQNVCVLDSDAFPVRRGWQGVLDRALPFWNKRFAAPIRIENGDLFPHISFVYAPILWGGWGKYLRMGRGGRLDYGRPPRTNATNRPDTGAALPMNQCLYLLRSNSWNPNPVFHSIYGDVVYHCGAGSRSGRPVGLAYWDQFLARNTDACRHQKPTPTWINRLVGEDRFPTETFPT